MSNHASSRPETDPPLGDSPSGPGSTEATDDGGLGNGSQPSSGTTGNGNGRSASSAANGTEATEASADGMDGFDELDAEVIEGEIIDDGDDDADPEDDIVDAVLVHDAIEDERPETTVSAPGSPPPGSTSDARTATAARTTGPIAAGVPDGERPASSAPDPATPATGSAAPGPATPTAGAPDAAAPITPPAAAAAPGSAAGPPSSAAPAATVAGPGPSDVGSGPAGAPVDTPITPAEPDGGPAGTPDGSLLPPPPASTAFDSPAATPAQARPLTPPPAEPVISAPTAGNPGAPLAAPPSAPRAQDSATSSKGTFGFWRRAGRKKARQAQAAFTRPEDTLPPTADAQGLRSNGTTPPPDPTAAMPSTTAPGPMAERPNDGSATPPAPATAAPAGGQPRPAAAPPSAFSPPPSAPGPVPGGPPVGAPPPSMRFDTPPVGTPPGAPTTDAIDNDTQAPGPTTAPPGFAPGGDTSPAAPPPATPPPSAEGPTERPATPSIFDAVPPAQPAPGPTPAAEQLLPPDGVTTDELNADDRSPLDDLLAPPAQTAPDRRPANDDGPSSAAAAAAAAAFGFEPPPAGTERVVDLPPSDHPTVPTTDDDPADIDALLADEPPAPVAEPARGPVIDAAPAQAAPRRPAPKPQADPAPAPTDPAQATGDDDLIITPIERPGMPPTPSGPSTPSAPAAPAAASAPPAPAAPPAPRPATDTPTPASPTGGPKPAAEAPTPASPAGDPRPTPDRPAPAAPPAANPTADRPAPAAPPAPKPGAQPQSAPPTPPPGFATMPESEAPTPTPPPARPAPQQPLADVELKRPPAPAPAPAPKPESAPRPERQPISEPPAADPPPPESVEVDLPAPPERAPMFDDVMDDMAGDLLDGPRPEPAQSGPTDLDYVDDFDLDLDLDLDDPVEPPDEVAPPPPAPFIDADRAAAEYDEQDEPTDHYDPDLHDGHDHDLHHGDYDFDEPVGDMAEVPPAPSHPEPLHAATAEELAPQVVVELRQVAGLTSGAVIDLIQDTYDFAEGDDAAGFSLSVDEYGSVVVIPGSVPASIDGEPVTEPTLLGAGVLDVGTARFMAQPQEARPSPSELTRRQADAELEEPPIAVPGDLVDIETDERSGRLGFKRKRDRGVDDAANWDFFDTVRQTRDRQAARERHLHPDPTDLIDLVTAQAPWLGSRQFNHPQFGTASMMLADLPWLPEFDDIRAIPDSVGFRLQPLLSLPSVPVVADLMLGPLGIVGSRAASTACARHLMTSLYAASTEELRLHVITSADRRDQWEWARSLAPAAPLALSDNEQSVVVIDGMELFADAGFDHADAIERRVSAVILADAVDQLPSYCATVLQIADNGGGILTNHRGDVIHGTPIGIPAPIAAGLAEDLVPIIRQRHR